MKKSIHIALLSLFVSFSSVSTFAKTTEQSITFTKGTNQKTQIGKFEGYDDVQYKIYAKKGQVLKFKVTSNNNLANMNIFSPGKKPGKDEAIFIGSTEGQVGEIILPSNGEYTIQVYQMRNSARQNKTVNFQLYVQILDQKSQHSKKFDAIGELPCSLSLGQPTRQCQFGVVRQGNGAALVTIFSKENKEYILKFNNGKLTSPSGKTQKRGDLSLVELNTNERFEIPDAVIYGG
ncbi:Inhibitor of g-type lysozyme precursor [compost metagenome]